MKKLLTISLLLVFTNSLLGQRINFKPFVQDETITATIVSNPLGLNFNNKQSIIVAGDPNPVSVEIVDMATVVIEIDAPIDYDITLEFSSTPRLSIGGVDTGITVPFNLKFAYNNSGETSDVTRRLAAIQVPAAFNVLTLPMRRRAGGPPGPPPTPDHEGYVRPRGKLYVYIYGSLGPAPSNTPTGVYMTDVNLTINYSDNAF